MRKTLSDVSNYLKETLVPVRQEKYAISSEYISDFEEDNIQEGILAFRSFLVRLYETLYKDGNQYDTCKKIAHEYENRTTLSVYYPFLHNVSTLLMNFAYLGRFDNHAYCLICECNVFQQKISPLKQMEVLQFLNACGLVFSGIDINQKKLNISEIESIRISYPDSPSMLLGMKAMSIAEIEHRTLINQDVFLRCDYRVLKKDTTDVLSIVEDSIEPLSSEAKEFVLLLHHHFVDNGMSCIVEVKGFHIYVKYCFKRKDVWGINASLNNGYHINVKSTKTQEYEETIKTFSPVLQEQIERGYGCGRKRPIGHCDGGCRGITIPLDDSILEIKDEVKTWLDTELTHLKKN
ncbi:hypothetical protein [Amedibacillus sp. YH-ame10]